MSQDFSEMVAKSFKMEEEKIKFGGVAYENCHKFPTIVIDQENKELYINYLIITRKICETMGIDFAILFASICNFHNISSNEGSLENNNIAIIDYCLLSTAR